jgi:hypothetical protein
MSFSQNGIRFSSACIRKFIKTEYIELKVHPFNQVVAVLPCSENHKNKMCWARVSTDGISVRTIGAKAYLNTIFELFDWDLDKRYRLRGAVIQGSRGTIALFDARTPEIFTSRYEMTMPWATGFGVDYYDYEQSRVSAASITDSFSEYNNEPDLRPTTPGDADKNIRILIENIQNNGGRSDA